MYDSLVKRLRADSDYMDNNGIMLYAAAPFYRECADAIEELSMKLNGDEAAIAGMKREIERMVRAEKPRWVPVTEALPESVDDDVLVTDGEGYAVGYWRPDAQAWDSTDFGWLENRSEPPCGIHTVTHWMPLPELPKEEAK